MRKKLLTIMMCLASLMATAQVNFGKLVPLHVDGNQFKDPSGNTVVLHGVMDTPNPYFNSYRWGNNCSDGTVSSCINYFDKLFTAITDSTHGAYCNLFRLHLDPCWTNGNSNAWKVDSREKGTAEADFSKYTGTRLTKYMRTLYWRIAQAGMKHGLYIIMRPPGVCPGTIYVDGSYQKYVHDYRGRNSRIDELQVAMLDVKLHYLDEENGRRKIIARVYIDRVDNSLFRLLQFTGTGPMSRDSVWHIFPLMCERRDELQKYLIDHGVETQIHYPTPPHKQKCYADWNSLSFPVTEQIHAQELSIPCHQAMTQEEADQIVDLLNDFR